MLLNDLMLGLAVVVLFFVILGGIGVWFQDEHEPIWLPPEPEYVRKLPNVYDWEEEDVDGPH